MIFVYGKRNGRDFDNCIHNLVEKKGLSDAVEFALNSVAYQCGFSFNTMKIVEGLVEVVARYEDSAMVAKMIDSALPHARIPYRDALQHFIEEENNAERRAGSNLTIGGLKTRIADKILGESGDNRGRPGVGLSGCQSGYSPAERVYHGGGAHLD